MNNLLLSKFYLKFQANEFSRSLPVAAKLALLNTRYLEYQHTCIESLETMFNCGTVVVTFYPNFNMALNNP
ncbi:hypothetical protein NC651_011556 [Populus alba x Populus x berolinensis]|nr:hypothetical protein NC651_011556 [Populus alba x Populus x berolinensis]